MFIKIKIWFYSYLLDAFRESHRDVDTIEERNFLIEHENFFIKKIKDLGGDVK